MLVETMVEPFSMVVTVTGIEVVRVKVVLVGPGGLIMVLVRCVVMTVSEMDVITVLVGTIDTLCVLVVDPMLVEILVVVKTDVWVLSVRPVGRSIPDKM
jgi:hypothetical protein